MNTIKLFLAAIIGGLVVFVGVEFFRNDTNPEIHYKNSEKMMNTLYTNNQRGEAVPLDFTETAKKVTPSVVNITSYGTPPAENNFQQLPDPFRQFFGPQFKQYFEQPESKKEQKSQPLGTGSGVIINSDGYIVTNNHVVKDAEKLTVTMNNNKTYDAKVVGTDPNTDLALVKINATGLPALTLINSDKVEVGQWVLAVGNPYNLNSTVTAGIVSAKARNINIIRAQYGVESFIQTDAAINPGNSGGALVNLNGDLVGINTAIASPTGSYAGYGFAIPSNLVNKVVSDLLKYGKVERAILGVTIRNNNSDLAKEKKLSLTTGAYVDSVSVGGAADKAGIEKGDVIIEVNGDQVNNSAELQEDIAEQKPGEEVTLTVMRNGNKKELNATLKGLDEVSPNDMAYAKHGEILRDLGVRLRALTAKESDKLGIKGGVVVQELYPGKLVRETKIQEGFVITGVDNKPVTSVDEFVKEVKKSNGGVLIEGIYPDTMEKHYYGFSIS